MTALDYLLYGILSFFAGFGFANFIFSLYFRLFFKNNFWDFK